MSPEDFLNSQEDVYFKTLGSSSIIGHPGLLNLELISRCFVSKTMHCEMFRIFGVEPVVLKFSCCRPQTKLREGNVFTGVCQAHGGGGPTSPPLIVTSGGDH